MWRSAWQAGRSGVDRKRSRSPPPLERRWCPPHRREHPLQPRTEPHGVDLACPRDQPPRPVRCARQARQAVEDMLNPGMAFCLGLREKLVRRQHQARPLQPRQRSRLSLQPFPARKNPLLRLDFERALLCFPEHSHPPMACLKVAILFVATVAPRRECHRSQPDGNIGTTKLVVENAGSRQPGPARLRRAALPARAAA